MQNQEPVNDTVDKIKRDNINLNIGNGMRNSNITIKKVSVNETHILITDI